MRVSWTLRNPGRRFFGCKKYGDNECNFFDWVDKEKIVPEEMKDVYHKMRGIACQKEDWRAVIERVKELNTHLLKSVESKREIEKNYRESTRNARNH